MKINKTFAVREVCGKFIAVPVGSACKQFNGAITLNATGAFLFDLAKKDFTLDSLVSALCDKYEVSEADAKADAENFISTLKNAELLDD